MGGCRGGCGSAAAKRINRQALQSSIQVEQLKRALGSLSTNIESTAKTVTHKNESAAMRLEDGSLKSIEALHRDLVIKYDWAKRHNLQQDETQVVDRALGAVKEALGFYLNSKFEYATASLNVASNLLRRFRNG